jgi:hypothetical protein
VPLQVVLQRLHLVGEVGALAPDVLEAVGDLAEHAIDGRAAIAADALAELDVADLDGCERHGSPSS